MRPDVTLQIRLLPTSAGGRQGSTPSDKFKCWFKVDSNLYDCCLMLDEVGSLNPGESALVPVLFLQPDLLSDKLHRGQSIALCEGKREIAEGTVVEIFLNQCHKI